MHRSTNTTDRTANRERSLTPISPPNQTTKANESKTTEMLRSPPLTRKFRKWNTFCVVQPYSGTLHSILINWTCQRNQAPRFQNSGPLSAAPLSISPTIPPAPLRLRAHRSNQRGQSSGTPSHSAILIDRAARGVEVAKEGAWGCVLTSATAETMP